MAVEPKEWNLVTRRSINRKSGGIHAYINSKALHDAGIPNDLDLEVKQYGLRVKSKNGKIIGKVLLKFRKVKK